MQSRIWLCAMLFFWMVAAGAGAAENSLLKKLIEEGVPVGSGPNVKLPPVKLVDGLDAAAELQVLESVADENHPLKEMLRKISSALFQFKLLNGVKDFPGAKTARRVDLYFVAYGDLDVVASEGFWKEQGEGTKKDDIMVKVLESTDLAERKLTLPPDGEVKERYGVARLRIFDTVEVTGGARVMQTRSPESVTLAILQDRRFDTDSQFPNQWRKLVRDPATTKLAPAGAAHRYVGMGAYVKATSLKAPAGALFIEYHLVFDEPDGWFEGAKLLSTKLPILTKDNVEQFRRNLDKKMKEKNKAGPAK